MILTDEEIKRIGEGNTGSWQDDLMFARAIESAVLAKLKAQEPFAYFSINDYGAWEETSDPTAFALYEHPDPRVAELEAVLRECREALVHCADVFDEVRGYPITYDLTIEAITKIYEVLK